MRRARKTRHAVRGIGLLWALVIAGALAGNVGGIGQTVDASSVARGLQRQAERDTATGRKAAPLLIAVGDIADCGSRADTATAALVQDMPGTVATLGDHVYDNGTKKEFADCYDPAWGRDKDRTRPAAGNHDYGTRGARGYFDYFGNAAGDRGEGYYSYDLGTWHIVVLNSNCAEVGGCGADSRQGRWLRKDLAANPVTCTLAYWHHPLFSSGKEHGGDQAMKPVWETLYDAGADVVLSAHEHNYERFAPQDADGRVDRQRGIRQFVVGTGGASHYGFGRPLKTSEARNAETFGALVLTLHRTGYDWRFVPADAGPGQKDHGAFSDSGSGDCH